MRERHIQLSGSHRDFLEHPLEDRPVAPRQHQTLLVAYLIWERYIAHGGLELGTETVGGMAARTPSSKP